MNQYQWENEIRRWIEGSRNIENDLAEAYVHFFTLAFENTYSPERAWFGIHNSRASLVVGGIFLAAVMKSGKDNKGIWLLLEDTPEIEGWESSVARSTKNSPDPLKWFHTQFFDKVVDVLDNPNIWQFYKSASRKILKFHISSGREEQQKKHGKRRLSTIYTPFAPTSLPAIDNPEPPKRIKTTVNRIIRDTAQAQQLKRTHNFCCQVCGTRLKIGENKYYAEVHHIRPLGGTHNGTDDFGNMLVLCPNHHALFDYGIPKFVSANIVEIFGERYELALGHKLRNENIEYHNQNIYHQVLQYS